MFEHKAV